MEKEKMSKQKTYTGKDIQVLSDQEHVRKRVPIYLGSNEVTSFNVPFFLNEKFEVKQVSFVPAAYKAVGEIIDNSIDEFTHLPNLKNKSIVIEAVPNQGYYTVTDNGRGVPIDVHATGKHTPEVVFGSLRSGRNFDDENKTSGVIGTNGVGSSVTCFTSTLFEVTIFRDHKKYHQRFTEGSLKITKPKITELVSDKTGTSISFKLDPTVFKDVVLADDLMHNRAMEIALCNPGVSVEYNKHVYKFKKGFEGIVEKIAKNDCYHEFKYDSNGSFMQWFIVPNLHNNIDEQVFSWINGSYLFDGGLCNTQFLNAFYDKVIDHLQPICKKQKIEVTKNDIRQGLSILGNIRIKNPQYDSQAKTRLTGPSIRNEIVSMLEDSWASFARRNKDWIQRIVDIATERHHRDSNKQAEKQLKKQSTQRVPGLRDATSKHRSSCRLFITEGLSAAGQITEVRDPEHDAIFTLTGKMNNVYGASVAQLMKMEKIIDLLAAIGLVPGKKAQGASLRYGQIIITTDADYDGDDINTLLVNLFFQFWPELFESTHPLIFRLITPSVVVSKGDKRVHLDKDEVPERYKTWSREYMKGLGSMIKLDWEQILAHPEDTIVAIINDGQMNEVLSLLFDGNADRRKQWLIK